MSAPLHTFRVLKLLAAKRSDWPVKREGGQLLLICLPDRYVPCSGACARRAPLPVLPRGGGASHATELRAALDLVRGSGFGASVDGPEAVRLGPLVLLDRVRDPAGGTGQREDGFTGAAHEAGHVSERA